MTRPVLFVILFCLLSSLSNAQYYLQHLVNGERSATQFLLLKKLNIRQITATSFEADDSPTENFFLRQELKSSSNTMITYSKSDFTGTSVMNSTYDNAGRILKVVDSSETIVNVSNYFYGPKGQLEKLTVSAADSVQDYAISEVHLFEYNAQGHPSSMLRIKDKTDTTKIVFLPAENGKPGEEQWWKKNRKVESWYYYYDDKARVTDVARFNKKANTILPDYVFEYDEEGRVSQQTTVQAPGSYRIWKYIYDERGLKVKEGIFNKGKVLEGQIEYSYQ